jgi:glyoxylase-like metal-dependent hydrolase (beta-lactamase superfamily II)
VVRRAREGLRQPAFVGQTGIPRGPSTSDGIILIDTIFDYSVEAEVVDGLKKLGLDPSKIKYAIVSHGHGDHSGGAKYLQDRFGTRVIMGAPDWEMVARSTRDPAPKRDVVATDGQKLTLGDTTLTLYLTPGHTRGRSRRSSPSRTTAVRISWRRGAALRSTSRAHRRTSRSTSTQPRSFATLSPRRAPMV